MSMKKIIIVLCGVFLLATQAYADKKAVLILDLEGTSKLLPPFTGSIFGYTDEAMGGDSTINELKKGEKFILIPAFQKGQGAEGTSGFLKISGKVTTKYQYGYVGCGFIFYEDQTTLDLTKYKGVRFYAKGSNRPFAFRVSSPEIKDFAFYEATFKPTNKWKQYTIEFDSLAVPMWAQHDVSLEKALSASNSLIFAPIGQPIESYLLQIDRLELLK